MDSSSDVRLSAFPPAMVAQPSDHRFSPSSYAQGLLRDLGSSAVARVPALEAKHPDLEWAASGAMWLTGLPDGPPLLSPAPLASAGRAALAALATVAKAAGLSGAERIAALHGAALLGERAALSGFARRGGTSAGGSCHLLESSDGWIAVNLARADDVPLLGAWLGEGDTGDPLTFVRARTSARTSADLVASARELGLPVAEAAMPAAVAPPWHRVAARSAPGPMSRPTPPLVVDLSSLWAGPLAAHLLALAGARVIKVESTRRPDGARRGPSEFYDLMNAGKESVAFDFTAAEGRRTLAKVLAHADIIVEASRPRALAQLGIDAHAVISDATGKVWLSMTGYGRSEPACNWIAFGDDAAAAAGLAMAMRDMQPEQGHHTPVFCGDAIADPLTGIHAAVAALSTWYSGGGVLLDVNLHDVTAHVLGLDRHAKLASTTVAPRHDTSGAPGCESEITHWEVVTNAGAQSVLPPRARPVTRSAAALGDDTETVLRELGITC